MVSNVKFPWEQGLGRVGLKAIEQVLSYFAKTSLEEVDLGIDLQCELIEHDKPSIPFLVQAKGTEHFADNWRCRIRKSTINYWLMQRSPVYLIVYDEKTRRRYWMAIEDLRYNLLRKLAQKNNTTVSLKLDKSHILRPGKEKNHGFIEKVKDDQRSISQFWGYPQLKGHGYIKTIPPPPRSGWEMESTKENVRIGLYSVIQQYIRNGDTRNALICARFLRDFDESHYNHFVWLGYLERAIGNFEEAKEGFTIAVKLLEHDQAWPKDSKNNIISAIRKELEITDLMQKGKEKGPAEA